MMYKPYDFSIIDRHAARRQPEKQKQNSLHRQG